MKNLLCTLLSGLIAFSNFQCTIKKSENRPAASSEASEDEVQNTENEMEDQNGTVNNSNSNTAIDFNTASELVDSLLKSNDLYIKDFDGKDIALSKYRQNPSQYFLVFRQNDANTDYNVLNTSLGDSILKSVIDSKIEITYKIYRMSGDMDNFNGDDLSDPVYSEKLELDLNFSKLKENKEKFEAFFDKLENVELAANHSSLQKLGDFLFPKAYGDTAKFDVKDIQTIAIVFSSVALIAYVFAIWRGAYGGILHNVGLFTGAVGLVFWLLYWIDQN